MSGPPIFNNCTFILGRNSDEAKLIKGALKPHSSGGHSGSGGHGGNNNSGHGNNGGSHHSGNNNSGSSSNSHNGNNNSSNGNHGNNNSSGSSNNNSPPAAPSSQNVLRKIALLIGLNYAGTANELNGCINDVNNMKKFLLTKGFAERDIKLITDANSPVTIKMVMDELKKLCVNENALLVFHYSGHGSNRRNNDSDENEADGMDETIYVSDGDLHDDKIRKLVSKTPASSKLFAVFDSCHSGTICDLRYNLKVDRNRKKNVSKDAVAFSLTENSSYPETAAQISVVSGCKDEETSADSFENGSAQGALSANLIPLLSTASSWKKLITDLAAVMKEKNYEQNPQLSFGKSTSLDASHPF